LNPERQICFFTRSRYKVTPDMKFKAKRPPLCVFYEFLTTAGGRRYYHSMMGGISSELCGLDLRIAKKGSEIRS